MDQTTPIEQNYKDNDDFLEERELYINSSKNPNKRVNIIDTKSGKIMRTTRSLAEKILAESDQWKYTSKSKLKSFLNKESKLHHNKKLIEIYGTEGGHGYDEDTNKSYSNVPVYSFIHSFSKNVQIRASRFFKKLLKIRRKYRDMTQKAFIEGLKDMPDDRKIFKKGVIRVITKFHD